MSDLSGRSDGVGPASPSANAVAGAARSLQFASIGVHSRFPLVAAKGRAVPSAVKKSLSKRHSSQVWKSEFRASDSPEFSKISAHPVPEENASAT